VIGFMTTLSNGYTYEAPVPPLTPLSNMLSGSPVQSLRTLDYLVLKFWFIMGLAAPNGLLMMPLSSSPNILFSGVFYWFKKLKPKGDMDCFWSSFNLDLDMVLFR
jgi:hypothetical protein